MATSDSLTLDEFSTGPLRELAERCSAVSLVNFRIAYDNQSVDVSTNDAISRRWAEFYLAPIMRLAEESIEGGSIARYLHVMVSPETLEELVSEWSHGARIPLQMRRTGSVLRLSAQRSVILDEAGPIIYVVDHLERDVLAIGVPTDTNRKDLARQCRELLIGPSLRDGWVVLHASAVGVQDRATLFVGGKGAGKSTLALQSLNRRGAKYISNDRVLVKHADGEVLVRPYPMSVRLGGGTLRNNVRLAPHLHAYDHLEAALLPLDEQYAHSDKLELGLTEFLRIMECELLLESRLDRIVFPRMDPHAASSDVYQVPESEVARLITPQLYVPDPDGNGWLRDQLFGADVPALATVDSLSEVPGFSATGDAKSILENLQMLVPTNTTPPKAPIGWRREVQSARLVAVMDHMRQNRALKRAAWNTRAVKAGEVHEILTTPEYLDGRDPADRCWYIGFAKFEAGLLCVGDRVLIGEREIGVVAGFDDTHMPNHMNIIVSSAETRTGVGHDLEPGDCVTFVPQGRDD